MRRPDRKRARTQTAIALCTFLMTSGCRARHPSAARPDDGGGRAKQVGPSPVLWAWETPQDFRALDPTRAGVAFLAREVILTRTGDVLVRYRRQPLLLPAGMHPEAVVRLIAGTDFHPAAQTAAKAAAAIAAVIAERDVRAVQVDFDATASQRDFYRRVLENLHALLPPQTPLSITALVSWCGSHSWLRGLPINQAVPMFFRMGGPTVSRAHASKDASAVTEPLCSTSIGLATDEVWPAFTNFSQQGNAGKSVYIFHPGSWTADEIRRLNAEGFAALNEVH